MTLRMIIAGGTGTIGRLAVAEAERRGHEVVVLARSTGLDLSSGTGVARAMEGGDVVIDLSNTTTASSAAAHRFFTGATRTLLDAERKVGIGHHIALSIVGIDRATTGYFGAKLAQERLVAEGGVPWTILRATPFHEFAAAIYDKVHLGPLHLAPRMRTQPVGGTEIASTLIDLAESAPAGRVPDLAGPCEENLVEMVRDYARSRGSRGWIPAVSLPGEYGRMQRDGSILPGTEATLGHQTFSEWLALGDG